MKDQILLGLKLAIVLCVNNISPIKGNLSIILVFIIEPLKNISQRNIGKLAV